MSAEVAWPARPSNRGLPSPSAPSISHFGSNPSSPSPRSPASPNFAQGSFTSSSSSAYDPSDLGTSRRLSSSSLLRRKSEEDETRKDEGGRDTSVKRTYAGTPLPPDRVARIAQAFGVNISLPQPPSSSNPQRLLRLQEPARSTFAFSSTPSSAASHTPPSSRPPRPNPTSPLAKHFISVLPPISLAPKAASPAQFRRGELLPLHPTLQAQVQSIAKEYGLPSTVGIVLFLVYEGSEDARESESEPGPRIGKETWKMLWQELFASSSVSAEVGDERGDFPSPTPSPLPFLLNARGGSELRIARSDPGSSFPPFSTLPSSSLSSTPPSRSPSHTPSHSTFFSPQTPIASSSLLSRDPATLSPSFFASNSRPSSNFTPTRHRRTLTASTTPSSTSSTPISASTNAPWHGSLAPSSPQFPRNTSSPSPSHYLSPASARQGGFAPPPLRIVGTVEFDIDQSRGGEWYGTWLKGGRRGIERVGIIEEPSAFAVQQEKAGGGDSSPSDFDDDNEDGISDGGSGYQPLSDAEDGEESTTRETSEEPKFDDEEEPEQDGVVASGRDPLGDVFPSDEQEWNDLRATRQEEDEEEHQGLGIRSSIGGKDGLILTGEELSRGLDGAGPDDFDVEDGADLDRKEIEELLARHPPTPGFGPTSGDSSPISATQPSSTPSTRRNTTSSRPSRLTLASPITLDIPSSNFLPVLTTSPTASEANSQGRGPANNPEDTLLSPMSEFSGGLAYLRGGSMDESRFGSSSNDSLDGGMSAALYGAFGVGEHEEMLNDEDRNRSSAFLMHESLNDLEKALRSLSPRDLRIPNRDRPYDASPNSDVSFSSVAILPPPSNLRPQTPPNTRVFAGPEKEDSPSAVPVPQFRGKLDKAARDSAVLSIASSFMSVRDTELRPRADVPTTPHSGKSTFADMMAQEQDVPPVPSWPAVPLVSNSPELGKVALPARKESPLHSPTDASSGRFPDAPAFVPGSPPAKISEESMQRMQYDQPRVQRSGEEQKQETEELWQPRRMERAEEMLPTSEDFVHGSTDAPPRTRSNSVTRALKNINWGRAASVPRDDAASNASNGPHPSLLVDRNASFDGRLHPSFSPNPISSSVNGRPPTPSPTLPSFPSPPSIQSPRSVSDSTTFPHLNQFGKYSLTPDDSSSSYSPSNSSSPKGSSKGRSRFKAPFSNPFGKKRPSNASEKEITSPEPSSVAMFPSSSGVSSSSRYGRDESPSRNPNQQQQAGRTSLPHSLSNLSSSNYRDHQQSPPASPVPNAPFSPRKELRRKPVPTVGGGERTSTFSTHSRGSSIADSIKGNGVGYTPAVPDAPLPVRSTSLGKANTKNATVGLGVGMLSPPLPKKYELEEGEGLA